MSLIPKEGFDQTYGGYLISRVPRWVDILCIKNTHSVRIVATLSSYQVRTAWLLGLTPYSPCSNSPMTLSGCVTIHYDELKDCSTLRMAHGSPPDEISIVHGSLSLWNLSRNVSRIPTQTLGTVPKRQSIDTCTSSLRGFKPLSLTASYGRLS